MKARRRRWRTPDLVWRLRAQARSRRVVTRGPGAWAAAVAGRWRGRRVHGVDATHPHLRRAARHRLRPSWSLGVTVRVAAAHRYEGSVQRPQSLRVVRAVIRQSRADAIRHVRSRDRDYGSRPAGSGPARRARVLEREIRRRDYHVHTHQSQRAEVPQSSLLRGAPAGAGRARTSVRVERVMRTVGGREAPLLPAAARPIGDGLAGTRPAPRAMTGGPAGQEGPTHGRSGWRWQPFRAPVRRAEVNTAVTGPAHRSITATPSIEAVTPMTRRAVRVERMPADRTSLASATPRAPSLPPAAPIDVVRTLRSRVSRDTASVVAAPDRRELERTIAAAIDQQLDRKVGAVVRATLQEDAEISRTVTDRVYGDLYDRMVLERERLR